MPRRGAIYILAEFCKRERVFCLLFLGGIKILPATSKPFVGQFRGVRICFSGLSSMNTFLCRGSNKNLRVRYKQIQAVALLKRLATALPCVPIGDSNNRSAYTRGEGIQVNQNRTGFGYKRPAISRVFFIQYDVQNERQCG